MDNQSLLDTEAKREAFKFYEIHGLVRHLKDCIQICVDLKNSEHTKPAISPNDVQHMLLDLSMWHERLLEDIPFVGNWVEVTKPTVERIQDATSSPDSRYQPCDGRIYQTQTDCRCSPKIT